MNRDAELPIKVAHRSSLHSLPWTLPLAVRLMYLGAFMTAVALMIDLVTAGSQRAIVQATFQQANPGHQLSGSAMNTAVEYVVIALVIGATIRLLFWLWMACKNQPGSWARIVGTIFGVINLGSVSYLHKETAGSKEITVLDVIVSLIVIALMWHKDSSTAYHATQGSRRLGRSH